MNILLQYILPHKYINKLAKLLADCEIVCVKNFLINWFIKRYPVNMQEAEQPDPFAYNNYNDFFTRKIRFETRNVNKDANTILGVADGVIANYGEIKQNILFDVKGSKLILSELLIDHVTLNANVFNAGKFITTYLAPHNYHRVHMPVTATLERMLYIPGTLFSVNIPTVNKIPNVFTKNERVVAIFNSSIGKIAIILVGAMIVGSIVTSWHGVVHAGNSNNITTWDYTAKTISLEQLQEMGLFKLGSTVIVLFANSNITFAEPININKSVQVGDIIARI